MPGGMCCVVGCNTNSVSNKRPVFRIPSEIDNRGRRNLLKVARRKAWIAAIRRKGFELLNLNAARVCSLHFIYGKPSHLKDHPDYVPNQNMGYSLGLDEDDPEVLMDRYRKKVEEETVTVVF